MQPIFNRSLVRFRNWPFSGFTLIELVIVIVLMGGVATLVSTIFANPFLQYESLSRRAAVVSLANAAIARMEVDLKNAVPNSIRLPSGNNQLIEFMNISDGGRYRYVDDSDNSEDDGLSPGFVDSSFHVIGNLTNSPVNGSNQLEGIRLVVNPFNTLALYTAATTGGIGVITPASTVLTRISGTASGADSVPDDEDQISLSTGFQFDLLGNGSPRKRFYLTDTGVIYRCDLTNGTITRYTNYDIQTVLGVNIPTNTTPGLPNAALLINQVTACEFKYEAGIAQRLGVVTFSISVNDDFTGETVSFVKQLRINNVP